MRSLVLRELSLSLPGRWPLSLLVQMARLGYDGGMAHVINVYWRGGALRGIKPRKGVRRCVGVVGNVGQQMEREILE